MLTLIEPLGSLERGRERVPVARGPESNSPDERGHDLMGGRDVRHWEGAGVASRHASSPGETPRLDSEPCLRQAVHPATVNLSKGIATDLGAPKDVPQPASQVAYCFLCQPHGQVGTTLSGTCSSKSCPTKSPNSYAGNGFPGLHGRSALVQIERR